MLIQNSSNPNISIPDRRKKHIIHLIMIGRHILPNGCLMMPRHIHVWQIAFCIHDKERFFLINVRISISVSHQGRISAVGAFVKDDVDSTPRRHPNLGCVISKVDPDYRHDFQEIGLYHSDRKVAPVLILCPVHWRSCQAGCLYLALS